jgi:hypothetical protein
MKNLSEIKDEIDSIYDLMDEDDPVGRAEIDALEWVIGQADPPIDDMKGTGKLATEDEIKKCIELLRKERTTLPEYSFFRDPNWRMIDAQIEQLQWILV